MSAKPILFNTEMVKAILDGRKNQTRRLIKPAIDGETILSFARMDGKIALFNVKITGGSIPFPLRACKYEAGDLLWVRETWAHVKFGTGDWHYEYRADQEDPTKFSNGSFAEWRPSIHMPKDAARLFLRVTGIRCERLQDMTAQDSLDEGVKLHLEGIMKGEPALAPFARLWDSTLKKGGEIARFGWAANPWVWVIEFEREEGLLG